YFFRILRPPRSALFPYTTLFRSRGRRRRHAPPLRPPARDAQALARRRRGSGLLPEERGPGRAVMGPHAPDPAQEQRERLRARRRDRKSTRLNSSHVKISYAVFCL